MRSLWRDRGEPPNRKRGQRPNGSGAQPGPTGAAGAAIVPSSGRPPPVPATTPAQIPDFTHHDAAGHTALAPSGTRGARSPGQWPQPGSSRRRRRPPVHVPVGGEGERRELRAGSLRGNRDGRPQPPFTGHLTPSRPAPVLHSLLSPLPRKADGGGLEPHALASARRLAGGGRSSRLHHPKRASRAQTERGGHDPQARRLHPLSRRGRRHRRITLHGGRRRARSSSREAPAGFEPAPAPRRFTFQCRDIEMPGLKNNNRPRTRAGRESLALLTFRQMRARSRTGLRGRL